MSFVAWIILGLVSGFIASKLINKSGEGLFLDVALGMVGAMVGGFVFTLVGAVGITSLNVWSLFIAVAGATVLLGVYHLIVDPPRMA